MCCSYGWQNQSTMLWAETVQYQKLQAIVVSRLHSNCILSTSGWSSERYTHTQMWTCLKITGWWFGTFIFPYTGNVIIPILTFIFFRGVGILNHQPDKQLTKKLQSPMSLSFQKIPRAPQWRGATGCHHGLPGVVTFAVYSYLRRGLLDAASRVGDGSTAPLAW